MAAAMCVLLDSEEMFRFLIELSINWLIDILS